jgi:uncharacterized flavoprotein (TIGR03862 family)
MGKPISIAIIGAGPSGLFAAEQLATSGFAVTLYDQMPSPGRKFLMAGRGGLNLTHSEPLDSQLARYGAARPWLEPKLRAFPPEAVRAWADGLGAETFVGSSGRIFPRAMKASPLLRNWLRRLERMGVTLHLRHRLEAMTADLDLSFATPSGLVMVRPNAVLLACGGASWPRLGSDGSWAPVLAQVGVKPLPIVASNVGALIPWSRHMQRHYGQPLKRLALRVGDLQARGEAVITERGLEGGAIYALSQPLRAALTNGAQAVLTLDLRADLSEADLAASLTRSKKGETQTNALRRLGGLSPQSIGVLREAGPLPGDANALAKRIKACALPVTGMGGIERAISSIGGVRLDDIDEAMMLRALPGVFVAGEMLDWDAPTGGYLLQACFSLAFAAANGLTVFARRGETA